MNLSNTPDLLAIVNHLPAGVVVHALDTSIVYANPRALELLRMSWDEAIGRKAVDPSWHLLDETGNIIEPELYPVNRVLKDKCPVQGLVLGVMRFNMPDTTWLMVNSFMDESSDPAQIIVTFTDISEYHKLPFRQIVDNAYDAILICDAEHIDPPDGPKIVYVNPSFCKLTEYSLEEVLGKTPRILQGPGTERAALDRMRTALTKKTPVRETLLNYTKSGKPYWLDISIFPLFMDGRHVTHFAAIERDVSGAKNTELIAQNLAQHDPLTGLLNRRGFDAKVAILLTSLRTAGRGYALLSLDIDYFKKINDNYGHAEGDEVLKILSATLQRISRENDLCARFGGEEFVLLLPNVSAQRALQIAQRIRSSAAELRIGANALAFTLSVGVAIDPLAAHLNHTMIAADEALYKAKNSGRNQVCLAPDDTSHAADQLG